MPNLGLAVEKKTVRQNFFFGSFTMETRRGSLTTQSLVVRSNTRYPLSPVRHQVQPGIEPGAHGSKPRVLPLHYWTKKDAAPGNRIRGERMETSHVNHYTSAAKKKHFGPCDATGSFTYLCNKNNTCLEIPSATPQSAQQRCFVQLCL